MSEAALQRIQELTEKVNQLLLARETVSAPITVTEPEFEFITTRAPASELKIYPMLKDAFPSIEEDFFGIQSTEEEQKEAITRVLEVALAQATRPVDYYVHRIIQDNPGITSDDPRFLFADTMRVLLSGIAATVTQGRLDNLHRGMDLPGKPQQLVESEVKPLMDQDKLDALIAQKAQAKRARIRKPFCGRQQYGTQNSTSSYTAPAQITEAAIPGAAAGGGLIRDPNEPPCRGSPRNVQTNMEEAHGQPMGFQDPVQGSEPNLHGFDEEDVSAQRAAALWATAIDDAPTSVQAEAQPRSPPDPDRGSVIFADKESNRRGQDTRSRLLQPTVRHTKEDRGTQTCSRHTETKLSCRREKLQDGVSCLNMQTNQAKELHGVSRSRSVKAAITRRRIHAHSYTQFLQEVSALLLERESIPIQSAPVWTVSQPAHFYQGAPPDTIMGENTEHQNICIPGRHPNYCGVEKDMQEKYGPSIFQTDRAGIQNKVREVDNNAISANNPSWYDDQFTEHEPQSSFLQDLRPPPRSDKTIESWPDDVEMPGELYWKSPSYVGCPAPGSSNAETTLATQEKVLIIDEDMDINCDTHRARQTEPVVLERPIVSLEWPIVPLGDPRTGTLYRCQRHRLGDSCGLTILFRIVESFGGDDAHQHQRTITNIIRTPAPECCWAFSISLLNNTTTLAYVSKFCVATSPKLLEIAEEIWNHCIATNTRPQSMLDQAFFKITELYRPHYVDLFASRANTKQNKILQLVPRQQSRRTELSAIQLVKVDQPLLLPSAEPDIPGSPESAPRTSDNYFSNTSMENSNLVSGSTGIISCSATSSTANYGHTKPQKRKISDVEQQELMPHGMENQRRVIQAQGLSDTAINIIVSNKLAVKRRSRYHSTQKQFLDWHMTKNQSTAIQSSHIVNYPAHIFKTKKLITNTIKSYKSAILNLVADPKTVGNSPCIKEFLRAIDETKIKTFVSPEIDISPIVLKINDDIHRIDDARTIITEDTLKLINRHPNHILCLVLVYTVYKARIATELCPTPHANNNSIIVNKLFRHTKHYNKPLSIDSITRHVKNLSVLIVQPPNKPIPKARATGATFATTFEVPVENIVLHTFRSNVAYSIPIIDWAVVLSLI
ncbi:hypothetical protein BB561_002339 [Smittium simulii]|uniref:Uncharacterized protein n=1 Tax=Smittium simulii TaxID=133385 RepID=A0A2T9YQS9_9FUNG|nr:hypothetical protein BB561_002339 [Smittium simulii]